MSGVRQIIITVTIGEVPKLFDFEHYIQNAVIDLGLDLRTRGVPVHTATCAHSKMAIDPRRLNLSEVLGNLNEEQVAELKTKFPTIWLSLALLIGANDDTSTVS
jgi:hypothetical protein